MSTAGLAITAATLCLLGLPLEVRLEIYDFVDVGSGFESSIGPHASLSTKWVPVRATASALIRTCTQLHDELADRLSKRRIDIMCTCRESPNFPLDKPPAHGFLRKVRKLNLQASVRLDRESQQRLDQQLEHLEEMLQILSESKELQTFSFWVGVGVPSQLKTRFNELRRATTREGVRQGKTAKERELLYAFKVVELLKTLTGPEYEDQW